MNKLSLIISFCLVFVLFSSCAPDLTDDVEWAFMSAGGSNDAYATLSECEYDGGLMWSSRSSEYIDWNDAVSYCNNLTECGYSDWRLPTISELRTLIQNCSVTVTGGSCGVTDSCLSLEKCTNYDCFGCDYDSNGKYSKFGEIGWFWSSSVQSDNSDNAWCVYFLNGKVGNLDKYDIRNDYVRCVR